MGIKHTEVLLADPNSCEYSSFLSLQQSPAANPAQLPLAGGEDEDEDFNMHILGDENEEDAILPSAQASGSSNSIVGEIQFSLSPREVDLHEICKRVAVHEMACSAG